MTQRRIQLVVKSGSSRWTSEISDDTTCGGIFFTPSVLRESLDVDDIYPKLEMCACVRPYRVLSNERVRMAVPRMLFC